MNTIEMNQKIIDSLGHLLDLQQIYLAQGNSFKVAELRETISNLISIVDYNNQPSPFDK